MAAIAAERPMHNKSKGHRPAPSVRSMTASWPVRAAARAALDADRITVREALWLVMHTGYSAAAAARLLGMGRSVHGNIRDVERVLEGAVLAR